MSATLKVISAMSEVPDAVVGAGTVISPDDVVRAKDAGATFGVLPGFTDALLNAAELEDFPLLPGAATASEVITLGERGYDILKFFPAEAAGGIAMLKSLAGPLPAVSFCPTGGANPNNVSEYLALPNVVCAGGSWIAPSEKIESKDWAGIEVLARHAAQLSET